MPIKQRRILNGRKTLATAAAVLAAGAALGAQPASAQEPDAEAPDCAIETLPIPEGTEFTFTTAMSDDGSIVAYRTYPLDPYSDFSRDTRLWRDGEITEVPIPGEEQSLTGVNTAGTAVGNAYIDDGSAAYLWHDGELSELSDDGTANDISEAGDIAGALGQHGSSVPVVWPADGSGPVELSIPDHASWGVATSIDEDGTVVGFYEDAATGDFKSYLWAADGTPTELPMPEGYDPATTHSYPQEIDEGWVAGNVWEAGSIDPVGVRWNLADGTAEVVKLDFATSVNPEGWVSGTLEPNAAVVTGEDRFELPGVAAPEDNWFGDQGLSLSDDGHLIAGNVYVGENEYSHVLNAVVWTCE